MEKSQPSPGFDAFLGGLLSGENDPQGIFAGVQPAARKPAVPKESALRRQFAEIVAFYEKNGRSPALDSGDIFEGMLGARLKTYQGNAAYAAAVADLDTHGLLSASGGSKAASATPAACTDFESVLEAAAGLLPDQDPSIFKIEHVTEQGADKRAWPEEIASRKPCEDFENFERLFQDAQRDIVNRKVQTARFRNETQIEVGDFFILSGLLCIVDSVLEADRERAGKDNPRLRVVFENGIETNILKLSFARALYRDPNGRRVIPDAETVEARMQGLTHKDRATGCIYILASETRAPALADLKRAGRLVKIGYSTQSVEERVKNAAADPTYLEAPVKILASLDCFNLNPQKVEHLIHAFLARQRLQITLISSKGAPYTPTEWFAVDRDTAIAVAEHIVKGDIMDYRMDNTTGRIKRIAGR